MDVAKSWQAVMRRAAILAVAVAAALATLGCEAIEELTVYVPGVGKDVTNGRFGGQWSTGLQVLNQDDAQPNPVTIRFYAPDGTQVAEHGVTLAAGGSTTLFGPTLPVRAGFDGSATVRGERPVKVIANTLLTGSDAASSHAGTASPHVAVHMPRLVRSARVQSTIQVMNATPLTVTTLSITFKSYEPDARDVEWHAKHPLPPHGSLEVALQDVAELGSGDWMGGATINSEHGIAVAVHEGRPGQLASYNPAVDGTATLFAPLVMTNNRGFDSSLGLISTELHDADGTLTIYATGSGQVVHSEKFRLAGGKSHHWAKLPGTDGPQPFVGSAVIALSPVTQGEKVEAAGVALQAHAATGQMSFYALFPVGTDTVVAPLVQGQNAGWETGIQVMNTGTQRAQVTLRATDTSGAPVAVADAMRWVEPKHSTTWFPISRDQRFIGSAVVSGSPGAQLVAVVNQLSGRADADHFTTYEGINRLLTGLALDTPQTIGKMRYAVKDAKIARTLASDAITSTALGAYVVAFVEATNLDTKNELVATTAFRAMDAIGRLYVAEAEASVAAHHVYKTNAQVWAEVPPGATVTIPFAFDVPPDARNLLLVPEGDGAPVLLANAITGITAPVVPLGIAPKQVTYDWEFVVQKVERTSTIAHYTAQGQFVVVTLVARNMALTPRAIDASVFKVRDAQGQTHELATEVSGHAPEVYKTNSAAGKLLQTDLIGTVPLVFDVPADATGLQLMPTRGDAAPVALP